MKKSVKFICNIVVFCITLFFLIIIHEMSHCFVAIAMGGKCIKIAIQIDPFLGGYCIINTNDPVSRAIMLASGSIGGCIAAFIIMIIVRNDDVHGMYLSAGTYIISELSYWATSPIILMNGDCFMLLQTLDLLEYSTLVSIIFFILMIIAFILYCYDTYKLEKKSYLYI